MAKEKISVSFPLLVLLFLCCVISPVFSVNLSTSVYAKSWEGEEKGGDVWASGLLVKRERRIPLVSSEYGEISAVQMGDEDMASTYLVHFFTLEPNSLFLPVILHEHMVFYVQTGSGKLSWVEENDFKNSALRPGDVYRLQAGTVFFLESNLETDSERHKLRIHAIFADSNDEPRASTTGPYSSIRDMVLGFDKKVLQATFKVSEELMDELLSGAKPPAIVHGIPKTKKTTLEMESQFISGLVRSREQNIFQVNKKKWRKVKLFNLFEEKKDFENANGWSTTVTGKKFSVLKDSNIGLFMVNLTRGSIMGPHWNPVANEIGIIWQGQGMVRIVCSSTTNETGCKNVRFKVEEGDVFAVPRLHPMAQMAFENDTFVFAGFSTSAKRNHPQFFAGQASVLKTLDRDVVSISFNVTKATLDQLLAPQKDSVILGCTLCAEEELRVMEEEQEEARQREEEEARKKEEEEARKEEEERKRQEEEEEKREEEARKKEEEEAKREEEERRRREEEEEKRREEEARKREEEEAKREEEERKRREEEEKEREREAEARKKEEEAEQKRREEAAAKKREEEERRQREEEARRKEEKEAKREEAERERREEEEEAAAARKREEDERRQREEEEAEREEDEWKRREEEEEKARKREEEAWEEEERKRREEEEEVKGRQEGEAGWEEEEEAAERREMEKGREEAKKREEDEKARQEEEAREKEHRQSEEERGAEEERRWEEEQEEEEAERHHAGRGDREKRQSFSWDGKNDIDH